MSYDKCKTCLHQNEVGQPIFDDKNCAICITQGNYLGYEPRSNVENSDKESKYATLMIWISLILVHTCFIIACLAVGLYISVFTVNVIWTIVTAFFAAIIDIGFIYIIYLLLTGTKFKKR